MGKNTTATVNTSTQAPEVPQAATTTEATVEAVRADREAALVPMTMPTVVTSAQAEAEALAAVETRSKRVQRIASALYENVADLENTLNILRAGLALQTDNAKNVHRHVYAEEMYERCIAKLADVRHAEGNAQLLLIDELRGLVAQFAGWVTPGTKYTDKTTGTERKFAPEERKGLSLLRSSLLASTKLAPAYLSDARRERMTYVQSGAQAEADKQAKIAAKAEATAKRMEALEAAKAAKAEAKAAAEAAKTGDTAEAETASIPSDN